MKSTGDFEERNGGDYIAERYGYIFIIWQFGDMFCGVCKKRSGREMFRLQARTLNDAKMICKQHKYWDK